MTDTSATTQAHSTARGLTVTALMMATALLVVGQLYAYLPLLSDIARQLETTAPVAGWTTPAFALSQAVGLVAVGWLNQRFAGGRLFAAGLSALALATATTAGALASASTAGFLLGRVAQGLTAAAFPPFAIIMIVEHTSPRLRPSAVGLFSASLLLAAPLGQLLATAIARSWSASGVLFVSALALVPIAAGLWLRPLTETKTPRGLFSASAILTLFHWRTLGRIYAVTLTLLMGLVFYYAAIQASGASTDLQWFRLLGAPAVLMTLVAGALLYRCSSPGILALGLTISAVGALITGLTGGGMGLQVGHWLMLGGVAAAVPAVLSFLGGQPIEHRQRAIVFYTIVLFAGASLGTPLVTAIDDTGLSLQMALLAAVYGLAAAAAGSYRWWPSRLAKTRPFASGAAADDALDEAA